MDFFKLFSQNFWLICLTVFGLQTFMPQREIRERRNVDAEFAANDISLRWRVFMWGCIPWLAMAAGHFVGGVPTIWSYFRPKDGNPWVLLFFLSVFVMWCAMAYWVYVKDGACAIVEHCLVRISGLGGPIALTPFKVKIFVGLALIGGIVGATVMFASDMPFPCGLT